MAGLRSAFCGMWLLAVAAPPEPGLEMGGSIGGGRYRVTGCGEQIPTYYSETSYAGNIRYRAENGVTVAADASGSTSEVRQGPDPARDGYAAAARLGWHGRYFGVEGGIAALDHERKTSALPSAVVWAGVPELHAFGTLMANRYAVDQGDLTLGVGHTSRYVAASVGASVQGLTADIEVRPIPQIAPTVSVRFQDHQNWNVATGFTFRFDPFRASAQPRPSDIPSRP